MQFWWKHKFTQKIILFRANAVSFEGCADPRVPFSGLEAAIYSWRKLSKIPHNVVNIL